MIETKKPARLCLIGFVILMVQNSNQFCQDLTQLGGSTSPN